MKRNFSGVFFILIFSFLFISGCSGKAETNLGESVNDADAGAVQEQKMACPRGMEHDPAPGLCGLYVDENKDGYCDYE